MICDKYNIQMCINFYFFCLLCPGSHCGTLALTVRTPSEDNSQAMLSRSVPSGKRNSRRYSQQDEQLGLDSFRWAVTISRLPSVSTYQLNIQ